MPSPTSSSPIPPPQQGGASVPDNPYAALVPKPGQQQPAAASVAPPQQQQADNPYASMVPGAQEAAASPKATAPGLPVTILDQASRGLSMGFAPQLMGGIKAAEGGGKYLLSQLKAGPSWGVQQSQGLGDAISKGYTSGRDALRAQYDQETAAHPAISRVADIGGSIGGALISGGTNLLGGAVERFAPKVAGNMLGRVLTRGTLPAIEAGAERAIGETRDNNYAGNVARSLPASVLLGSLFGAAGQIGGRLAEARAGAAAKGAQYAASDAAEIRDAQLIETFRNYLDRPGFAKAYQKAVDEAADEGNPLPELPMRQSQAPLGNVPPSTSGTAPSPFPEGLPVRLLDAVKRKVDLLHSLPLKDADRISDKAYNKFYSDLIHPADEAVPSFGAARASAEKVIQARQLAHSLISPSKSLPVPLSGAGLGYLFGHPAIGGAAGITARIGGAMARQPAALGAVPDATAALSRAFAAAAARRDGQ